MVEAANPVTVSIVIKALNEEAHIEAAIRSALAAVDEVGGEVILADSNSSDKTVEIASRFPITIVQLKNERERRCGVGPQLGYEVSKGEFVYILDGDMELDGDFLTAAVDEMRKDERLGGVAGSVEETSAASYQFRGRKRRDHEGQSGYMPWLDMGGLYRRTALQQAKYFSNKNLHAFEEQDLGLRLGEAGWRLKRLPVRGVRHHGYTESSFGLLMNRLKSRYLDGAGELLRASLGRPYLGRIIWSQKHLFIAIALWVGLVAGLLLLPVARWPLGVTLVVLAALIVIRAVRTRSIGDAIFGQVVWQVTALALVRGFLTKQGNPEEPIEKVVVKSGDQVDRQLQTEPDSRHQGI